MKRKKESTFKNVIKSHIKNNLREYAIVSLLFITGIIIGIIFINNATDVQRTEITAYMDSLAETYKNSDLNNMQILKKVLMQNSILAILLWFIGSTVIGIVLVYGIVLYKGICLGYTISAAIATFGSWNGFLFSIAGLFLQNIFSIPAILALAVSGMKLHQSIMRDKRRENIKLEIIRHTIFSIIMWLILLLSGVIETYASVSLLEIFVKYM